jgi:hypothetical protein
MRQNLFDSVLEDCVVGAKGLKARSGAATTVSNAATVSQSIGKITTESLSTAAGANQAITITVPGMLATDIIFLTLNGGTDTNGSVEMKAVAGAGSFVITLTNRHASAAFNGTFIIAYMIVKVST